MSVICKLVSIDGCEKTVIMPSQQMEIKTAWADLPRVLGKHEDAMMHDHIKVRAYRYMKTEPIHVYKEYVSGR